MASDTYSFDILGVVSNGRGEEGDARAEERPTVKRSGYSRHKCTLFCVLMCIGKNVHVFQWGSKWVFGSIQSWTPKAERSM